MMAKSLKFEDALDRLKTIVETLENGSNDLDQVIKLFEEGSKLVAGCSDKLSKAEMKIKVLTDKMNEAKSSFDTDN
jgi:exodeoxyribonuclease VII small subunit